MIQSEIRTFKHEDGTFVKAQKVTWDSWKDLQFYHPSYNKAGFDRLAALYRDYTVPKYRKVFGQVILYTLPEGWKLPYLSSWTPKGEIYDSLTRLTVLFEENIRIRKGELTFKTPEAEKVYRDLEKQGCLVCVKGDRQRIDLLPVGKTEGFLSEALEKAKMVCDAGFFTMDRFDLRTAYDFSGVPVGLCVKDGKILHPPLFGREVLLKEKGKPVRIGKARLEDLTVKIDGRVFRHGENSEFCTRPEKKKTPKGGVDLVIVNNRMVSKIQGGESGIPSGGFTVHLPYDPGEFASYDVTYEGLENVEFAIQAGNSAVINGKEITEFRSPFYDYKKPWKTAYPPVFYLLDYEKDRAPRMILGSDAKDRPVLVWIEGEGKFHDQDAKESAGASLRESARIAKACGIVNGVHLDGGGSAEILLKGKRELRLSDRDPDTYEETERAIPLGLWIP